MLGLPPMAYSLETSGELPLIDTSLESKMPQEFGLKGSTARFVAVWSRFLDHACHDLIEPSLVTVCIYNSDGTISLKWIKEVVEKYKSIDDVWEEAFLATVLIIHPKRPDVDVSEDARAYLNARGTKRIITRTVNESETQILPGPYTFSGRSLYAAWKLYEDTHNAFLHTLVQDSKGQPVKLRTAGALPQTLTVAVPSHILQSTQNLAGLRVATKDNFHIKNVRMSACNRAYYELSPPPLKTAACLQRLVDLGAVIVGTTKLASFAATEEPIECIDWQAPWNPRADGYQSPAGSSSGSGAAIAAYDWLDIGIGSDTSGSGRRPALWNGCFAMRPTHGILSHEGLLKSFPRFDVPTFFGRSLETCRVFAKAWYGQHLPWTTDKPYEVIYPQDYMKLIGNEEQMKLLDSFVADLETSLGVKHQNISFDQAWENDPPAEAGTVGLQDYMRDVSRDSFFYEDYHNFDEFREEYRQEFGKEAYVSPPVRRQWELSSHITSNEHEKALGRLEVYRAWFNRTIMKPEERNTIVLIPIEEIAPRYRDEATSRFKPVGVPNLFLSPILKAPELTLPIGEYAYSSRCTGRVERLPVAISMIGSPGQDVLLFDVALKCLKECARPTKVLAGRMLFAPVGGT